MWTTVSKTREKRMLRVQEDALRREGFASRMEDKGKLSVEVASLDLSLGNK